MRFLANYGCTQEEAEAEINKPHDLIGLDVETVSLANQLPVGIGIAVSPIHGFYFYDVQDPLLNRLIESASTVLVHNAKFDVPLLARLGHRIKAFQDTAVLAYSNGHMQRGLEHLAETELLRSNPSVTSLWRERHTGNIGVDHAQLGDICITHAMNCYRLWEQLDKPQLYWDIDRPYLDCMMEMESHGLLVDQRRLTEIDHETTLVVKKLEEELYEELGRINLASNPQVAKALQQRGVIGTRKTKAGADSVSDESLAPLHHPLADKLLEHRKLMKILNTYIPLFRNVDERGRVHTNFGFTETGRLTSSKPNLQNIGQRLRTALKAPMGYRYVSLDASQLELRVVGILSQDPLLMEALASEDLHLATAIRVFGWTDDPSEMNTRRYNAKQINFATLYGATEVKIAEMIDCEVWQAAAFIQQYFSTFPVLCNWMEEKKREAKHNLYTTNLFGRKRPIPDLLSPSWKLKEKAQKEIINTIVQGTAADIVKLMQMYLKSEVDSDIRFVLQVHDEILLEVPEELYDRTVGICKTLNQAFPQYPCTIKTGIYYGELDSIS